NGLPARTPNLLIIGSAGIAVGMATNIPPHNLSEVIDATIAYIDNNEIEVDGLMEYIKGPDFPTGGIIYGIQGVREAYETGRGRLVVRARTEIENTPSGRERIVVSEIPYMVNKADMIKKTADLINEKKIDGISYINDESDRQGMRIVIILKRDATSNVVLNKLFKYTQLQNSFNVNCIALVNGRPRTLTLKQLISYFVKHRHQVVLRRTKYELEQAQKRAHIIEGLLIALDNLDAVITLIRKSKTPDEAKTGIMKNFDLTEVQAKAILDMRLHRLTGLERDKIREEFKSLMNLIEYLNEILSDESLQMKIIKDELIEIKERFGDERRTEIVPSVEDFDPEDFYADEDMVITISRLGYIKRTPLVEFKRQGRGGIGSRGGTTRDEDFLEHLYIASMHNTMLFFTKNGKCYWLKVYQIPEGSRISKGRAIQNILNIEPNDFVLAYINVQKLDDKEYINNNFIILGTKKGIIKKTTLEAYSRPRQNGINAINIREGDQLLEAKLTNGNHEIMMAVRSGRAIRFHESKVRPMGRTASGVRGITLSSDNDEVIGMVAVENEKENILVVSEKGYGKRSKIGDYRITNRGGKGVKTLNITKKTGKLIAMKGVLDTDDLMIINRSGLTIRVAVSELRVIGRTTQGVKLINLKKGDSIAAVAYVEANDENEAENNSESHENAEK
ncbi:MAG: DNA gyrase subunit A, partial [Bacteroidetes bacterium]|nr:DNA gyrase subunit A [Bacteroidota bacterium]